MTSPRSSNRFSRTFDRLGQQGACGLFPYLTAGFPDVSTSHALADAALDSGADGFEIGVPFSDPLADGATLQRANAHALEGGATLDTAFDLIRHIRARSPETPIALMSYYNPLRRRGDRRLAAEVAAAEADAVIVPDLPAEESAELRDALRSRGLGFVPFLAPTSGKKRVVAVAGLDPVFIYCVALVGVTGARDDLAADLADFLDRVRAATATPLVLGFGISQPDHVRRAARYGVQGVIVASALTDLVERSSSGGTSDPIHEARAYLAEMKGATTSVTP